MFTQADSDLKTTFFRDGAKLYALARQNGGQFISQGYTVALSTAAARRIVTRPGI